MSLVWKPNQEDRFFNRDFWYIPPPVVQKNTDYASCWCALQLNIYSTISVSNSTLTAQLFNCLNKIHSLKGETGTWKYWCMYRSIWKEKVMGSFLGLKNSDLSKSAYFLYLCIPRIVSQLCVYYSIHKQKNLQIKCTITTMLLHKVWPSILSLFIY